MPDPRRALGQAGERAAARYLTGKGYRIEARNARRAEGELDLVARAPDGTLVFVEVRSRRGADATAEAAASVDARKQHRLAELAAAYLQARPEAPARIDVITVAFDGGGRVLRLEHLENAVQG